MRRSFQWTIILGVLLALTLGVAACGGDDNGGSEQGSGQGTPAEGWRPARRAAGSPAGSTLKITNVTSVITNSRRTTQRRRLTM